MKKRNVLDAMCFAFHCEMSINDHWKAPMKVIKLLLVLAATLLAGSANAGCEIHGSDYIGWEIIYSGQVTGYIDDNGREIDEFEGCEHGRVLIVDYSRSGTCAEYRYSYAYRPDIVVLSNGDWLAACIDDRMYDFRR